MTDGETKIVELLTQIRDALLPSGVARQERRHVRSSNREGERR